MTRWIAFLALALIFVFLLAPAHRSAESSSNKSYASDDVLTLPFNFTGEGPWANDLHIKWHQRIKVTEATGNNPTGSKWKVDEKENSTDEMMLKGEVNLGVPGTVSLVIERLNDNSKSDFWDLVESYQWSLDGKYVGKDGTKFQVWTKDGPVKDKKKANADKNSSTGDGGDVRSAKVATANGLRTVTFETSQGPVTVNLPDDMRAGDTISGTVAADLKGPTDRKIKIATAKKPDGTSDVNVEVSVTASPSPFTFFMPSNDPIDIVLRALDGITLTNPYRIFYGGLTTTVPIEMNSLSLQSVPPLKTFQLPSIGQQGRPIEIHGPFDGNSSNTQLNWTRPRSAVQDFEKNTENVSGGFGLIAESPRKAIFRAPSDVTGPIELTLNEGSTQTKGIYRNVGVNLTAPKTSLLKGESTELHVEVNGLQGLTQPVPLRLESHGVITMVGGNYQPLVIQPSQVGADGRYTTTRGITGEQAGGWSATATVVTNHPPSTSPGVTLLTPANNEKVIDNDLRFSWVTTSKPVNPTYLLSVFEVRPHQSIDTAVTDKPVYQWKGSDFPAHQYLLASKSIQRGKNYCWMVKLFDGIKEIASEVRAFTEKSTVPLTFPEPKVDCTKTEAPIATTTSCCEIVIMEVSGEVDVLLDPKDPKGKFEPVKKGMKIPVGATIVTGIGAHAIVAFGCSSVAQIAEATKFEIRSFDCTASDMKAVVFIDPGVCNVSVKQLSQFTTDFQVSTPRLTCGVRN